MGVRRKSPRYTLSQKNYCASSLNHHTDMYVHVKQLREDLLNSLGKTHKSIFSCKASIGHSGGEGGLKVDT